MTTSLQASSQSSLHTVAPTTTPVTLSRRYPGAPLVGVGVAIYNDQGQVLLVQSGKAHRAGKWGLPGGLIDLGETLVAAGIREVMEEVGLTIAMGDLVTTFEPILRDAQGKVEYHYVVLEYWAHYVSGEAVAQDDVVASAWVASSDLSAYSLTPEQLEVLQKTLAAWRAAPPLHSQAPTSSYESSL